VANSIDIVVPDLGDFSDVEVIEVLVSAGDRVAREDGLITLETDKASMDVPSPEDGAPNSRSPIQSRKKRYRHRRNRRGKAPRLQRGPAVSAR
jgi:hypothetical protein